MTEEFTENCEQDQKAESIQEVSIEQLLQSQLEKLQKEAQEYKEKYFLVLAEMENMRKRLQKEKQDTTRFAVENVIAEFITPLDNLEKALSFTDQMSEETRNWATGFTMLLAQFKDVLTSNGVTSFNSIGTVFDPNFHEAVEIEETTAKPDGTVLAEFLKGYKRGDRVLRPARVKVSKTPTMTKESPDQENNLS